MCNELLDSAVWTQRIPTRCSGCSYMLLTLAQVAGVDIDGVLRGKIMAKCVAVAASPALGSFIRSKFLALCKDTPPQFGFCSVRWALIGRQ